MVQIGDRVLVRPFEVLKELYALLADKAREGHFSLPIPGNIAFVTPMAEHCGKIATVSSVAQGESFFLYGMPFYWTECLATKITSETILYRIIRSGEGDKMVTEEDLPIYIQNLERSGWEYRPEIDTPILRKGDKQVYFRRVL